MATESGDKTVLGNFRKMIDEVSAESAYNPANTKLKLPALNTQHTAADGSVDALAAALAPNKLAISEREALFGGLRERVVRSRNFLKASGAPKEVAEDAEQFVRKLSGGRRKPRAKAAAAGDAPAANAETPATRSSSQMSYDNQVGHLQSYIEIVKNVSQYNPNEADLKVAALTAYADDLTNKSNAVTTTSAALTQARGTRDRLLYLDDDSVVNTAKLVKSYVQAALGSDSPLFKKIKSLKFGAARR
jgi:hypothetical protein